MKWMIFERIGIWDSHIDIWRGFDVWFIARYIYIHWARVGVGNLKESSGVR
jgi:hypothetical protein